MHRLSRVWRSTPSKSIRFCKRKFLVLYVTEPNPKRPFPARRRSSARKQRGAICTPQSRGTAITRSDAFAVVVAKLGFKPSFIGRAGNKDVSRRPCDTDVALAGNPTLLHKGLKPKFGTTTAWLRTCLAAPAPQTGKSHLDLNSQQAANTHHSPAASY